MNPETYRKTIAIGMLAVCLWMAAPLTADARPLDSGHRGDGVEIEARERVGLWQQVLRAWQSVWDWQSILIDPNG